jgi:recombination protein RecA
MLDLGVAHGLVEKSGSWYSYQGERIGQGRDNARMFLKEHSEIAARIEETLRRKLDLPAGATQERQAQLATA